MNIKKYITAILAPLLLICSPAVKALMTTDFGLGASGSNFFVTTSAGLNLNDYTNLEFGVNYPVLVNFYTNLRFTAPLTENFGLLFTLGAANLKIQNNFHGDLYVGAGAKIATSDHTSINALYKTAVLDFGGSAHDIAGITISYSY